MNQDSVDEPPSKRFKAESNGPTNNSNSEIKTASSINGIAFTGNFTNNRIVPISQSNAIANNSRVLLANSRMAPVQNLLSGVMLQQPTSQVQQTGSVGFLRLQSPVNARNITTIPRTPTPNASHINKQSTVFTLNTTGGVPLRIPLQGQQLRSSMALLQQVGNSSSSAPIVLQQPLLVQQQQHGRPFLVLQQPVTTGKQQNAGVGQSVTALVIPQASGGARPQSSLNLPQSVQQQLQNQLLLQKNQVTQAKHQQASQPQITVQEVTVVQANTHIPNNQNQTQLQQPSTSGQGQASNPPKSGLAGLDDGKKRFLQNQLFALLHARACKAQQNGIDCPFPICRKMQTTLRHMSSCKMGQKCKESLCSSSMHLLYHFKRCLDDVCGICQPVREKHPKLSLKSPMNSSALNAATPSNDATSDMKKTYEVLGLNQHSAPHFPLQPSVNQTQVLSENQSPVTVSGASNPIPSSTSIEVKKEWHSLVTEDLRAFLVQRLVTSVYRIDSTDALRSKELSSLVEQARKIESELYKEANSREDYYQRLAGRMHIIQQDLQNNHKILKALKTEANTNENTNGSATSSAQQQLQSILNKKKEELTSSEQIALTQEVNQTPNGSSSLAQGPEIKLENGIKIEPKDDSEGTQASSKIPSKKKVWGCNELRSYLMPVLEKLYRLDPESLPFRQPVDPKQLNIPDYFNIIKKPMDLSTIKRKLDTGVYADPWEFVDDMWLMFENAWLFNRKSSRVHKCCTKLAEVFEPEIDVVMKSMGFCCGRKYVFYPQVLCCYGKPMCTISVNAGYYSYQNRYVYCEPCFMEIKGDEVELSDDPTQPSMIIQKELFSKTKNNEMEPESFVECTHCGRKQHHICSMYHEPIWPGCFVCNHCVRFSAVRRKENKFTSKNLPQTKLSIYLENRINTFLRDNKSGASPITIRVHSVMEKCVEIKPGMKNRFCSSKAGGIVMSNTLPYTAKAIFAYQEVEGSDVCFFGMHVQEYGSNCPAPNTRRVYIAYLDSVNFFQPKVFRTSVYHEILIGYLDYVKNLGFASAHIWACPPSEGDDYIFHCHPQDMKIPKPKRLADWYKKMLDKAIIERVVIDYKDIIKDALENCMQNVTELPYFEGDFWPNVIETCIAELEREEHQRKAEISGDFDDSDSVHSHLDYEDNGSMEPVHTGLKRNQKGPPSNKKKSASKKSGLSKKNNLKTGQAYPGNDLMSKLFVMMEKHREVFFVVRLKNYHDSFANLPPIHDPDPLIATDMMDGRDNFLMMCREKHYEFSSLRRAKHSSMVMLYELHTQAKESFVYLCNYCRTSIETHYHCSTCDDFDLCVPCYQSRGHVHSMEKIGFDLDEDEGASKVSVASANGGKPGSSASENKKQSVQKCLQYLLHACQCNSNPLQTASGFESATTTCKLPNCGRMKQIIQHSKNCNTRKSGCLTCKQLFALCCCHARDCPNAQCPVPFCKGFRQRLEREKHERAQMMRRRMAAMQGGSGMDSFSTSYMQALNQRPVSAARAPVRAPISPAVAPTQPSVSQARPPFQSHSPNIRTAIPNAGPAVQQVKMPVADSVMSHAPEGTVDTTVSLNPELIQQLIKSQQNVGGRNIQDSSQLITILKNNPQLQACIKKKQERNHSNSPVVMGEDGRLVLEIPSSNPTLAASSASSQPRQQQIILACNPNIAQRATPSGNSMTGLMHISSSNRHVMLSQTHSTLNAGPSNMQDSTLPIQDRLSRYVDQL